MQRFAIFLYSSAEVVLYGSFLNHSSSFIKEERKTMQQLDYKKIVLKTPLETLSVININIISFNEFHEGLI